MNIHAGVKYLLETFYLPFLYFGHTGLYLRTLAGFGTPTTLLWLSGKLPSWPRPLWPSWQLPEEGGDVKYVCISDGKDITHQFLKSFPVLLASCHLTDWLLARARHVAPVEPSRLPGGLEHVRGGVLSEHFK